MHIPYNSCSLRYSYSAPLSRPCVITRNHSDHVPPTSRISYKSTALVIRVAVGSNLPLYDIILYSTDAVGITDNE